MTELKSKSEIYKKNLKKEASVIERNGGGRKWPVWVVQIICEMLTNGAPPSSIPSLLRTMMETTNEDSIVKQLPSVRFVRHCRNLIQILGETMAAIRLGRADCCPQLFTDGAS